MSLPTSKEITDLYLYGTRTVPDLTDEDVIREGTLSTPTSISVDVKEFMTSGGGRFASGDQFQLVRSFFAGSAFDGLQPGDSLSKADYAARLNLTSYGLNVYQRNVDDGAGDYAERVYIWNSLQYKISDNAVFKVNLDGTRVIENFGIQPVTNDNFDFASTDAGFADDILNSWIDPWGIGRQVALNFTGSVDVQVYDVADYIADTNVSQTWTQPSYSTLFESMAEIANELWDGGDTHFLDDDSRVIEYGTTGDDVLHAEFEQSWLTIIAENGFGTGAVGAGRLEPFEDFGFHVIAGGGNNTIYGSAAGDFLSAGNGNDIIASVLGDASADNADDLVFAAGGEDHVTVGGGSDAVSLGGGDDEVYLVAPQSGGEPNSAQTVLWGGEGIDSFYFNGGDVHVLSIKVDGMTEDMLKNLSTSALFNLVNGGSEWPYNYILINLEQQDKIFVDGTQLGTATVQPNPADEEGAFEFDYTLNHHGSDGWDYYDAHSMTRVDQHRQSDYYEMPGFEGEFNTRLDSGSWGLAMGVWNFVLDGFAEGAGGIHFAGDGIAGRMETTTTVQQITVTSSVTTEYHFWDNTAYYIPNTYTLEGDPEVTSEVPWEGFHIRPEGYESYQAPTIDLTPFLRVNVDGDSGDDNFAGSSATQSFRGGTGTDTVDYSSSADSVSVDLDEGRGESGDATDDRYSSIENIIGSDFGDYIYGNKSNNLLIGGDGDDSIGGDDGDDILQGGAGWDIFTGGQGNDLLDGGDEFDSLTLLSDEISDYTIVRNADNSMTIISQSEGVDTLVDVEEIALFGADAISLEDIAPVLSPATDINGTIGADNLSGTAANDIVSGFGGNDTIDAGDGNDIIDAGEGDDILIGGVGNDILNGGAGQNQVRYEGSLADYTFTTFGGKTVVRSQLYGIDILTGIQTVFFIGENASYNLKDLSPISSPEDIVGTNGDDTLTGTSGNDVMVGLAGDDNFDGLLGDDHLYGGIGNDVLNGGEGNDVYHYASGDGNDTISDIAINLEDVDELRFSDINLADLTFVRSGEDLSITVNPTGQVITVETQYFSAAQGWALETLTFADGTSLQLDHNPDTSWIYGTTASETIDGNFGKDYLFSGTGDDVINGSAGGDIYFYESGDGNDIINDDVGFSDEFNIDVLRLADLDASDLSIKRHGDDLEFTVSGTGDVITLKGQMNEDPGDWGIDKIEFANGNSWDRTSILLHGLIAEDTVTAQGTAGDDTLFGTSAHDLVDGGQGNDYLAGGYGGDTYLYSAGDGTDYIDDEANSEYQVDILKFTDLNQDDISAEQDGVHLKLTVLSTGDTITLDEEFYSSSEYWGIERIEFADGSSWDRDDILSFAEAPQNMMANAASFSESQPASSDIERPSAAIIDFPASSLEVTISDHELSGVTDAPGGTASDTLDGGSAEIISLSDFLEASEHADTATDLWYEPEPIGAVI